MVSRIKFVLLLAVAAFLPAEQIMAQAATLTGTVRTTAGTPVAGAFVLADSSQHRQRPGPHRFTEGHLEQSPGKVL